MKEELISYETAQLAKDKGFNIITEYYYKAINPLMTDEDFELFLHKNNLNEDYNFRAYAGLCLVPTKTVLMKWLRDVHGILIELIIDGWGDDMNVSKDFIGYRVFIWRIGYPRPNPADDYGMLSSYDEALEMGLQHALRLL